MTKQGQFGSITQQKKRINDDFLLKFDNSNMLQIDYQFSEINSNNDWCISAFAQVNSVGRVIILNTTTGFPNTTNTKGFGFDMFNNQVRFFYFKESAQQSVFLTTR